MATIPNLYLKWRALRELIGVPQSDAQIGATIFGEGREGAPKFSKLLYGDYGCPQEIGTEFIAIINRRIETFRKGTGLAGQPADPLHTADLETSLHPFIRKLVAAAGVAGDEALDRVQDALLKEMAPGLRSEGDIHLVVERFDAQRAFAGMLPSGGPGPITFQVGRHKGRLAVLGLIREPAAAYTFLTRDPRPTGHRSWELNWSETVLWLPSPSRPKLVEGSLLLMPEAAPVQAMPGRFLATTVLAWDSAAQDALDPRGAAASAAALNEPETSRFLTNLRRLAKRQPDAASTLSAEYLVSS